MIRRKATARTVYNHGKTPVVLATLFLAYYCGKITSWGWFSYHPVAMVIGSMMLPSLSAIIKKIGGYENTKLHGNLMLVATLFLLFGFYVIYTNKGMLGRWHIQTWHSKVGLGVLLGYTVMLLAGFWALHPVYGVAKTNGIYRYIHRWGSRTIVLLGIYASYTGFIKIDQFEVDKYLFIICALFLSWLIV